MYQYSIEPMPQRRGAYVGEPDARYKVVRADPPASIVDWSKAETMADNLKSEEAREFLDKLHKGGTDGV